MNKQVIITKEPGQVIPRGYLQEALKQCPSCIGITIQDVVDDEPVLDCTAENKTMTVDDLMKVIESCKDVRMVVVLGQMVQDFDPETDMQPFVFQQTGENGETQNILAFHVEGDYPNYSKPGKGHTDEFNFWEDCVFPTLLEKFDASDNLVTFFSKVAASPMKQLIENPIGHRGVAVFVPLEGDIIAFGNNELGGEFDWGTTSQTFGWGNPTKLESAAEVAVATVKKAGGRLAKLMSSTAPAPEFPKTEETKPADQPKHTTDKNGIHHTKTDKTESSDPFAAWPGTSSKTHVMRTVPSGLMGNARNRWIRLFTGNEKGELPKLKDHKDFKVPVPLALDAFAQEDPTTNDAVKMLVDRVKKFHGDKGDTVSTQMAQAHEVKNPQKPAAQPEGDTRPSQDFLPESPADEAKVSAELVTEWATNPKAPTSLEVQRIESKWPLFTKSRGITLENVSRWSIADKKLFVKKCPNDAARLISELVLKLHEYGAFDPSVSTEHQNDKVTESPATAPAQPGPAPASPASTGGKKGRLQRLVNG